MCVYVRGVSVHAQWCDLMRITEKILLQEAMVDQEVRVVTEEEGAKGASSPSPYPRETRTC